MSSTAPSADGDTRVICACYHDHCNFFWTLRIFSKPPFRSFFVSMKIFSWQSRPVAMNFDKTYIGVLNSWYKRSEGDSIARNRTKQRNDEITLFYCLSVNLDRAVNVGYDNIFIVFDIDRGKYEI